MRYTLHHTSTHRGRESNIKNRGHQSCNLETRINASEEREMKKKCVSRESNAGPIDGNDGFYH